MCARGYGVSDEPIRIESRGGGGGVRQALLGSESMGRQRACHPINTVYPLFFLGNVRVALDHLPL